MRSYIFTEREREAIREFLESGVKSHLVEVVISRMRKFRDLARDVELYLRLREAISA